MFTGWLFYILIKAVYNCNCFISVWKWNKGVIKRSSREKKHTKQQTNIHKRYIESLVSMTWKGSHVRLPKPGLNRHFWSVFRVSLTPKWVRRHPFRVNSTYVFLFFHTKRVPKQIHWFLCIDIVSEPWGLIGASPWFSLNHALTHLAI